MVLVLLSEPLAADHDEEAAVGATFEQHLKFGHHVIEAAGHPAAFRLSVEAVRPAGRVVWLGKVNVHQEVSFRWGSLMGEKRIVRSSYGDAMPQRDFPWLVEQYLEGRLLLDELITRRIKLDEINDGFADLAAGIGTRTVVEMPA